jgi:CO/xanthine dehydrogenase Mo-binding subunit
MDARTAAEALALAEGAATVRDAARLLRERYAPLRVVVVDAFEMRGETPAAHGDRRALYYGASDGHCWQVTSDPAQAAGFFLTERS